MNRIEALETTKQLWKWLALNPTEAKEGWPGWTHHDPGVHYCPLCEYGYSRIQSTTIGRERSRCTYCPLRRDWVPGRIIDYSDHFSPPCEAKGSPYVLWSQAEKFPNIRAAAALEIHNLCTSALTTIKEREARRVEREDQRPQMLGHTGEFSKVCRACGTSIGPKKETPVLPLCPSCQGPLKFERYNYDGRVETYNCSKCSLSVILRKRGEPRCFRPTL